MLFGCIVFCTYVTPFASVCLCLSQGGLHSYVPDTIWTFIVSQSQLLPHLFWPVHLWYWTKGSRANPTLLADCSGETPSAIYLVYCRLESLPLTPQIKAYSVNAQATSAAPKPGIQKEATWSSIYALNSGKQFCSPCLVWAKDSMNSSFSSELKNNGKSPQVGTAELKVTHWL